MQTFTRFGEPFTIARTRWMFGFQRRLVRRCEWLSDMPKIGFLPHTSHTELPSSNTSFEEPSLEPGEATSLDSDPPRCRPLDLRSAAA